MCRFVNFAKVIQTGFWYETGKDSFCAILISFFAQGKIKNIFYTYFFPTKRGTLCFMLLLFSKLWD